MSVAFTLPERLEASVPPELRGLARDGVRMLVTDRRSGANRDAAFTDLPALLSPGDVLVVNDSATLPAALTVRDAHGAALALHVSTPIHAGLWLVEPRRATPNGGFEGDALGDDAGAGDAYVLPDGSRLVLLAPYDRSVPRLWYALFESETPVEQLLARHGRPIRYRYARADLDIAYYQTVFARRPGSAEMPSAGRPFTPRVLDRLATAGVEIATLTLHCGVSSLERHERPLPERYEVPAETAAVVNRARAAGKRVIAIGTTVVRALETAVDDAGAVIASAGWTERIVTPAEPPRVATGLLTGFHEPRASHLDLLRAFVDEPVLAAAYDHALDAGYLWHEFGDVHLIV
jgi:S-adenosylmethionine:tRNA ribosyltransferase-isomerase